MRSGQLMEQGTQTFISFIPGTKGLNGVKKTRVVEPGRLGTQNFHFYQPWGLEQIGLNSPDL